MGVYDYAAGSLPVGAYGRASDGTSAGDINRDHALREHGTGVYVHPTVARLNAVKEQRSIKTYGITNSNRRSLQRITPTAASAHASEVETTYAVF
jgi:hypothetical protein